MTGPCRRPDCGGVPPDPHGEPWDASDHQPPGLCSLQGHGHGFPRAQPPPSNATGSRKALLIGVLKRRRPPGASPNPRSSRGSLPPPRVGTQTQLQGHLCLDSFCQPPFLQAQPGLGKGLSQQGRASRTRPVLPLGMAPPFGELGCDTGGSFKETPPQGS